MHWHEPHSPPATTTNGLQSYIDHIAGPTPCVWPSGYFGAPPPPHRPLQTTPRKTISIYHSDTRSVFSMHWHEPHSHQQPLQTVYSHTLTTLRAQYHVFGLRASSEHPHHLIGHCRPPPEKRFPPITSTPGLTSLCIGLSHTATSNHYSRFTDVHETHCGPTVMCLTLGLPQSIPTTP